MSLTAGAAVFTGDRRKHRLGPLLKSGGAGSVYPLIESPTQVAKIYHDSVDHAQNERKVTAMLYLSPNLPDLLDGGRRYAQIAWPQSLIRDDQGRFVGFLMPSIDVQSTSELECILQERQARAAGLPGGLGAKVTLAANLAAVIAELHRQGHHVIDLKPVNLRFYKQSLYMAMLDCDGFSIQGQGERFLAEQVTPDYLAPEFQSQPIPPAGEEQQDRFALAVVVFQLLNFGVHPFTGRPTNEQVPTDIAGRIAQRCYAYGLRANANMEPSPVSGHQSMPGDLRALFDRAFEGAGDGRPSASEWACVLRPYAQPSNQRLVLCARDRQHQHFAGLPCASCVRVALIANTAKNAYAARSAEAAARLEAAKRSMQRPSNAVPRVPGLRTPPLGHSNRQSSRAMRSTGPLGSGSTSTGSFLSTLQRPIGQPWMWRAGQVVFVLIYLLFASMCDRRQTTVYPYTSVPPANTTPSQQQSQPIPIPADSVPAAIRKLINAVLSGDPVAVPMARDNLRHVGGKSFEANRDYQVQYERGVLALENNDKVNANDWFMQAIGDLPDQAPAWYGLAIASDTDSDAIGALAIAELVSPGSTARTALPLAGTDAARFGMLKARGLRIVARLKGTQLPADVDALSRQSLPAK